MGASLVFLPILGNINLALATTMIGIILAVRTPISMIQSWTGKMADRWGALRLIIIGGALNVIAFVLLPWSIGFWTLLIFHALLSLGTALTQPAIAVYVVKEGRFSGMGSAMSISMMATQLGMGIGPILMGRITDYSTISIGFNSIAGLSLIGLILFAWNMHKHHPTD
jgi:MFS family permease